MWFAKTKYKQVIGTQEQQFSQAKVGIEGLIENLNSEIKHINKELDPTSSADLVRRTTTADSDSPLLRRLQQAHSSQKGELAKSTQINSNILSEQRRSNVRKSTFIGLLEVIDRKSILNPRRRSGLESQLQIKSRIGTRKPTQWNFKF